MIAAPVARLQHLPLSLQVWLPPVFVPPPSANAGTVAALKP